KPPGDKRMRRSVRYALVLFAGFPVLLGAQGFGIYELGTCGMGRAGTGVATPCPDGSAIFFNPAGLAGLKGWHVSVGGTLIKVHGGFTGDATGAKTDVENPWVPVPHAYVAYGATPKLGVGVGLFAPYGLETNWPLSFDGRFTGYKNIIRTLYIQPTAAYQVTSRLTVKVNDRLSIGGRYLMHAKLDYSGTATFDSVPTGIIVPTTIVLPGGLPPIPAGTPLDAVLSQFGVYSTLLPNQGVTTTITNPE